MESQTRKIAFEGGATIVEFSLVLALLLAFVVALIDFSRYFATIAILNKGAQNGLVVAKSLQNFGIDFEQTDPSPAGNAQRAAFLAARDEIDSKTTQVPLQTVTSAHGVASMATLIGAKQMYGPKIYDAIVLRPGDSVQLEDGTWIHHDTVCSGDAPGCAAPGSGRRARGVTEAIDPLFVSQPIVVEMYADIELVFGKMAAILFPNSFPANGVLRVVGRAVGYREIYLATSNQPTNEPPASGGGGGGGSGPPCVDEGACNTSIGEYWNGCRCIPPAS